MILNTDGYIRVGPDSTDPDGKNVDTSVLTQASGDVVYRERDSVADPADVNAVANVRNRPPDPDDFGLLTRSVEGKTERQLFEMILEELHTLRGVAMLFMTGDPNSTLRLADCNPKNFKTME